MSRWNGCNSIIIIIYFNFEQLCSSVLYTNTKYKHARHANCKASVFRCFMQRVSAKAAFSFSWSIKTFNFDNFALICKIYPNKRLDFFFILHILVPAFMRVRYLEMFDLWTHFLHHPSYVFPGGVGQCGFHGVGSRPDVCIHGVDTCGVNFN